MSPRQDVITLPLLEAGVIALNLALAVGLHRTGRAVSILLGGTSALAGAVLLLASVRILAP
jgi:hypothetical protein